MGASLFSSQQSVSGYSNHTLQQTPTRQKQRKPYLLTTLLAFLALLALLHFIAVTHTAYPTIIPTDCLGLIRHTDYTQIIDIQQATQQLEAVQFVDELVGGQPSAMLQVTDSGTQHLLDVYIYGCSMQRRQPTLTLLFKRQGLIQGTASITSAHTLSIGQLDTTLSADASALLQPLQQNVYQEYRWQYGAFQQVKFPGLYPVTSRSEAEALQDQADNGQTFPWSDPTATAAQMAQDLFRWPANHIPEKLLDNDGTTAHVLLTQSHLAVRVTLTRLVQPASKGLWFVTGAQTPNITNAQTTPDLPTASPMSIQGTVAQSLTQGQSTLSLFDHTLTPIPVLNGSKLTIQANGHYSGTLFYHNSVADQPGLLLIEILPRAQSTAVGQLLLTNVLLN